MFVIDDLLITTTRPKSAIVQRQIITQSSWCIVDQSERHRRLLRIDRKSKSMLMPGLILRYFARRVFTFSIDQKFEFGLDMIDGFSWDDIDHINREFIHRIDVKLFYITC